VTGAGIGGSTGGWKMFESQCFQTLRLQSLFNRWSAALRALLMAEPDYSRRKAV
jgi:hypothetical protein